MNYSIRNILPVVATSAALVTGFLLAQDKSKAVPAPLVITQDSRPIERTSGPNATSYAPMLTSARKSVVSVYTSEVVSYGGRRGSLRDQILQQLYGLPSDSSDRQGRQSREVPQGVGSGVIISSDGYILTNNHVVQDQRGGDADKILVRLSDDTELEAKLVGRDPKTDIAVIKVESSDLPFIKVADSKKVMVGDIVFAIGNPLGVGLTVTSGIISATERAIGIYGSDGYEDFIQTDAAINQGNSGGALVDIEGRLIGINSAIKSTSGGSIGLGFAIPSDLAIRTATQLTENGEVKRGLIGVRMKPLTPQLAEAMGVPGTKGVLIEEVVDGFPAKKAGIVHGDIITKVNNRKVDDSNDLRLEVSTTKLEDSVKITFLRDGKEHVVTVQVSDPNSFDFTSNEFIEGVSVATVNDSYRKTYDIPREVNGLAVTETQEGSPFARYLQPGVVILEINKRPVNSFERAKKLLRRKQDNLLYTYANGRASYFVLRLD